MNENELKRAVGSIKMDDIQKERILKNLTIRKHKPVFKIASIAAIFALLLSAYMVFAHITGIWNNIFNSSDAGINKSLEYDYVQNVNMDYIMSNGVGFKVESIILDDETFAIVYNLKLDHTAPNFDWVNLEDLVVKDENNIVLYGEGKGMITTGGMYSVASEDNIIIKIAHINSNENHNYPKSKKLFFSMSSVNLIDTSAKTKIVEHLTGDWEFDIDMADQFVKRGVIQYTPAFNERFKIRYAKLTSTGLNIEIEFANEEFNVSNRMTLVAGDTIYENERQISVEDGEKIIRTSFPITIYNAPPKITFIYDGTSIDLTKE